MTKCFWFEGLNSGCIESNLNVVNAGLFLFVVVLGLLIYQMLRK